MPLMNQILTCFGSEESMKKKQMHGKKNSIRLKHIALMYFFKSEDRVLRDVHK